MRYFTRLSLIVCCALAVAVKALAEGERRIALLIGNQGYSGDITPSPTRTTISLSWRRR
jgi:hypothetical protein